MDYSARLSGAVAHFWRTRSSQQEKQTQADGENDRGNRSAATGGKQLDGFIALIEEILAKAGVERHTIYTRQTVLPGFFRVSKKWDIVVVVDGHLLAAIELKSHVGPSFGNNYNNRVEEAMGSALDLWTAYRDGAFKASSRPWVGWLMLLEDHDKSRSPVKVQEQHFPVFDEFHGASYAERYEIFCEKLMRERLYDSTCLLLSARDAGLDGGYTEPNRDFGFSQFATSFGAHVSAFAQLRQATS